MIGKHQTLVHLLQMMVKKHQSGITQFIGTKQNTTLTTLKVGKRLNQTTTRKHLPNTIGMAQLGCPNRRTLKCLDQNQAH
jgi:hypothetical protein